MAEDPGPRGLDASLERIARGVRRIDLRGYGAIESVWGEVGAARVSSAVPVRLTDGELVVAVPSGAHAARARQDAGLILEELAALVADPPRSLRVVVRG